LIPIESEVEQNLDNQRLHQRLADMSEDMRTVLMMSFGMDDGIEKNVRAVAKETGMDKAYVSRLKKDGLEKLREEYKTVLPSETDAVIEEDFPRTGRKKRSC
jgi:DNA-directed RNA polymerase specialized sigma subunit